MLEHKVVKSAQNSTVQRYLNHPISIPRQRLLINVFVADKTKFNAFVVFLNVLLFYS